MAEQACYPSGIPKPSQALIQKLRADTGKGVLDCKRALYWAENDYEMAKHYLANQLLTTI